MSTTVEEIMEKLERHQDDIRAFGVRRLGIIGSYAKGDAKPGSDMDFLVEFDKKKFDNYMDLKFFLEDLFGSRVDLVIAAAVKQRLRKPIFQETVHAK
jgi:predicted nucleotidyltransferase